MSFTYPSEFVVEPILDLQTRPLAATVTVPGSKSITNRGLVLAALTDHCTLRGALHSEDTEVMVDSLQKLGWTVQADWQQNTISVKHPLAKLDAQKMGWIPQSNANLFVGNSGTTIRFLTAMLALGQGTYRLDGIPRMRERPIEDLLSALRQLQVDAQSETGNGCPPVLLHARGLHGGQVRIKADVSSQFLSGLLLASPFAQGETTLQIDGGLVSEPYIVMTLRMLQDFGLQVETVSPGVYRVPGQQTHSVADYWVEPDASSASYFFAAAAILGGRVTVLGLNENSLQGDVAFVDILEKMGCRIEKCAEGITVYGRPLRGVDVDMNAISDTVMTLGAVACFAEGPTTIRNVGHIRHKETDRVAALANELRRVGVEVEEHNDGLVIHPKANGIHGARIQTYNDHRMAMSMALIGLKIPGIVIDNPGCVAKTYPTFWTELYQSLRPVK